MLSVNLKKILNRAANKLGYNIIKNKAVQTASIENPRNADPVVGNNLNQARNANIDESVRLKSKELDDVSDNHLSDIVSYSANYKIVHQTWKSKILPEHFDFWHQSFRKLNVGYKFNIYDDQDNHNLVATFFKGLLPLYESFPKEIFRVDMIRPIYLYLWGGIYADLDFQCLKKLDILFEQSNQGRPIVGSMGTDFAFEHSIPNAFLMSEAGDPFWLFYLAEIEEAWNRLKNTPNIHKRPEYVTGPVVLKNSIYRMRKNINAAKQSILRFVESKKIECFNETNLNSLGEVDIKSGHVLYPVDWSDSIHQNFRTDFLKKQRLLSVEEARHLFPKSVAVTYWTHSW
jgi:mannosyltransferase OCH1-like enzyme